MESASEAMKFVIAIAPTIFMYTLSRDGTSAHIATIRISHNMEATEGITIDRRRPVVGQ
jgi:hypothetical protein